MELELVSHGEPEAETRRTSVTDLGRGSQAPQAQGAHDDGSKETEFPKYPRQEKTPKSGEIGEGGLEGGMEWGNSFYGNTLGLFRVAVDLFALT